MDIDRSVAFDQAVTVEPKPEKKLEKTLIYVPNRDTVNRLWKQLEEKGFKRRSLTCDAYFDHIASVFGDRSQIELLLSQDAFKDCKIRGSDYAWTPIDRATFFRS